ncbi:UNVERIFIED_CONTAM: Beta-fructofuranosidase, insoluble isoenzyme 3 [Sesamum angustifolium]|uniref:Beta-fructofuranosidase, insoluble isoenzyme 3 n=1 Tax=Sesamum angustifolium TaxID=2727405 RepID=A0AAW2N3X4_9LAMI
MQFTRQSHLINMVVGEAQPQSSLETSPLLESTVKGGLGPFRLLTSENLEEYTPVVFRVFKAQDSKHQVLMCSDDWQVLDEGRIQTIHHSQDS